ncbi:hypothetical protein DFH29DRAFT_875653 [Suillus ampliporus]|nr:hypothetical protein DFH29DRAFT_875653 [Suillus ampliporus]
MILTQRLQGNLALMQKPFSFTGYLAIGICPILYALYSLQCSTARLDVLRSQVKLIAYMLPPTLHHSVYEDCSEVPIFIQTSRPSDPPLDFDLVPAWSKATSEGLFHVYEWPYTGSKTIIVEAIFPFGHNPQAFPQFETGLTDIFLQGFQDQSVAPESFGDLQVVPGSFSNLSFLPESSTSSVIVPQSSASSAVVPGSYILSSIAPNCDGAQLNGPNAHLERNSLNCVQLQYPKWKRVLVNMRVAVRVAICCGEYGNPFVLNQTAQPGDPKAGKWVSASLSEIKCLAKLAITDPRPQLGLAVKELCPTDILPEMCVNLLQHFLLVESNCLPITANGFVWFLKKEVAKLLIYHLIYRASVSAGVSLSMANFAPDVFRDAPYLPVEVLVFVGASCYSAILQRLIDLLKDMADAGETTHIDMSVYLLVSQIYDELLQAAFLLFEQHNNPGYPAFEAIIKKFCNIVEADVFRVAHHDRTATATNAIDRCCIATANLACFLPIEHTENALESWLQKQSREMLSDSLFITVYMLFGWVDPLDLIAVLQMEVSLFSKAIVNLCKELNTKCHSSTWPKTVLPENTVLYGGMPNASPGPFGLLSTFKNYSRQMPGMAFHVITVPWGFPANSGSSSALRTLHKDCADTKLLCINTSGSFKVKEEKMLAALKSHFHTLALKKHCAQAEVDLFSEAIGHTAGFKYDDDGTCTSSGYNGSYESYPLGNCSDSSADWFDDWFDETSSKSSNGGLL